MIDISAKSKSKWRNFILFYGNADFCRFVIFRLSRVDYKITQLLSALIRERFFFFSELDRQCCEIQSDFLPRSKRSDSDKSLLFTSRSSYISNLLLHFIGGLKE